MFWLTAAGLLWAACDVIENKKFPEPPTPPVYDPGSYPGYGGQGYGGYGYGGYGGIGGIGGYGGIGAGGRGVRPDAGVSMSCGVFLDSCISSCAADLPFSGTPICDTSRGLWICPPGMVMGSSCPSGSCATTFLYCCDTATGAREPAGCTQGGYRGQCPSGFDSLTADACSPASLRVSSCTQLHQTPCSAPDLQCHIGGYDCGCLPRGDGGLMWWCPGLI